nr:MAG TPA: hypothetical protein [Caudoviricetes sp.]
MTTKTTNFFYVVVGVCCHTNPYKSGVEGLLTTKTTNFLYKSKKQYK